MDADYAMPSMEMATEHYAIGYTLSGDRQIITPTSSFLFHPGDVQLMPPFVYHRSFSASHAPYENYLVKVSTELYDRLSGDIGKQIMEKLFSLQVVSFSSNDTVLIRQSFDELYDAQLRDLPYREAYLYALLLRLMILIWEKGRCGAVAAFSTTLSKPIIDALSEMEKNYAQPLRLHETAAHVGLSPAYFSRLLKSQLGITFSEQLNRIRLRHVQEMLLQTSDSVARIAQETGFCSGDYLSARFAKAFGLSPMAFRKGAERA